MDASHAPVAFPAFVALVDLVIMAIRQAASFSEKGGGAQESNSQEQQERKNARKKKMGATAQAW